MSNNSDMVQNITNSVMQVLAKQLASNGISIYDIDFGPCREIMRAFVFTVIADKKQKSES